MHPVVVQLRHRRHQRQRHRSTVRGNQLQHVALSRVELRKAPLEQRRHRRGDFEHPNGAIRRPSPALEVDRSAFDQRPHDLADEERVAGGLASDPVDEAGRELVDAEHGPQQRRHFIAPEWFDSHTSQLVIVAECAQPRFDRTSIDFVVAIAAKHGQTNTHPAALADRDQARQIEQHVKCSGARPLQIVHVDRVRRSFGDGDHELADLSDHRDTLRVGIIEARDGQLATAAEAGIEESKRWRKAIQQVGRADALGEPDDIPDRGNDWLVLGERSVVTIGFEEYGSRHLRAVAELEHQTRLSAAARSGNDGHRLPRCAGIAQALIHEARQGVELCLTTDEPTGEEVAVARRRGLDLEAVIAGGVDRFDHGVAGPEPIGRMFRTEPFDDPAHPRRDPSLHIVVEMERCRLVEAQKLHDISALERQPATEELEPGDPKTVQIRAVIDGACRVRPFPARHTPECRRMASGRRARARRPSRNPAPSECRRDRR